MKVVEIQKREFEGVRIGWVRGEKWMEVGGEKWMEVGVRIG